MSGFGAWLTVPGNYMPPGKWHGESRAQEANALQQAAVFRSRWKVGRRAALRAAHRRRIEEARSWRETASRFGGVLPA